MQKRRWRGVINPWSFSGLHRICRLQGFGAKICTAVSGNDAGSRSVMRDSELRYRSSVCIKVYRVTNENFPL